MQVINKTLIFIIFLILALILVIFNSKFGIYSYLNENWDKTVALAGAVGTVVAAIATWLAANRAADGAEIAKQSMEASELAAKDTLYETQLFNRRTSFENRYALLLAQHDQYHKQLCDYIDTEYKQYNKLPLDKRPVVKFFENVLTAKDLEAVLAFLTGHEIISPYMRTLYHLLKFVYEDFYLLPQSDYIKQMKKYTSPVRSVIRNDVLLMIALNALNVIIENSKNSGYSKYQYFLHFFDFFEHAIFTHPLTPNEIFSNENWEDMIKFKIRNTQSNYDNEYYKNLDAITFSLPVIRLSSPVILCLLTYKNPIKTATERALDTFFEHLGQKFLKVKLENIICDYNEAMIFVKGYESWCYQDAKGGEWNSVTKKMYEEISSEVRNCSNNSYNSCYFKYPNESGKGRVSVQGGFIYGKFKTLMRYEAFFSEIENEGGCSDYLKFLQKKYKQDLLAFYSDISQYYVCESLV